MGTSAPGLDFFLYGPTGDFIQARLEKVVLGRLGGPT
jgi:hypothetical protein